MRPGRLSPLLALGLLVALFVACNFSFTTAKLSSLKIGKDEKVSTETDTFAPGDRVYAVADISGTNDTHQVTFKVFYEDVEGERSGEMVEGAEKTLDVEGSNTATFWITLPRNFPNGTYKIEVTMTREGERVDQRTAAFSVTGGETSKEETQSSPSTNDSDEHEH